VNQPLILSPMEQEYLLRIIESAVQVRDLRQFFLWTQGQLQALLPHQLMVCMQFDADGALHRLDALHGTVLAEDASVRLCDPHAGLALRLARHCSAHGGLPCIAGAAHSPESAIAPFQQELAACGYANLLIDGTGPVAGGATVFALFGLPRAPDERQAYFLALLLPHLHLAFARLAPAGAAASAPAPGAASRALSAREAQIMQALRAGMRNADIGALLGLSPLTVKNHLQRIYKLLGVRNRGEAVARCTILRLPGEEKRAARGVR
jgi:transcriptional regulator EpsA